MSRLPLALCMIAAIGCNKVGTTVLVTVNAEPPLTSLRRLTATATAGGQTKQFQVPLAGSTLPPAVSFAIDVPPSIQGSLSVTVTAYGSASTPLASANGSTSLAAGHRQDISVTLKTAAADMARPTDGAADLCSNCDAGSDMTPAVAAPRLLSPLSTSYATSTRPLLKWEPHGGAPTVDVCKDRFCVTRLATATVQPDGASALPDADLPAGVAFWRVSVTGATGTLTSATWELSVPHRNAPLNNASFGTFLDPNGDGFADVVIANNGNMPNPAGQAILYYGSNSGLQPTTAGKYVIVDGAAPGLIGASAASAGDLNGDGYGDLVMGGSYAPAGSDIGAIWVYYGGPNGVQPGVGGGGVVVAGPDGTNSYFGQPAMSAGDVNGDGYGDLLVTASGTNVGGSQIGRVHVYYGGPNGIQAASANEQSVDGPDGAAAWAISAAAPGDVNGDGFADIVVGDPYYSTASATHLGRVYVYFGSSAGLQPTTSGHFQYRDSPTGAANDQFGFNMAGVGDVDGDGIPDLAVSDVANALVFNHVPVLGLNQWPSPYTISNPDGAGSSFASVPGELSGADTNGDGYNDLIVGAQGYNSHTGRAHVFFGGGAAATIFSQGVTINAPSGDQPQFGELVVGLGDVDGNGYEEIGVSAPGVTDSRAYVFLGSSMGPQPTVSSQVIPFIGPSGAIEGSAFAVLDSRAIRAWLGRTRRCLRSGTRIVTL